MEVTQSPLSTRNAVLLLRIPLRLLREAKLFPPASPPPGIYIHMSFYCPGHKPTMLQRLRILVFPTLEVPGVSPDRDA